MPRPCTDAFAFDTLEPRLVLAAEFSTGLNLPTDNGPNRVETADFNDDGALDLVTITPTSAEIRFGKGDGAFGAPTVFDLPDNDFTYGLAIDDLNGNGTPDIVAVSIGGGNNIVVINNRGDGTFSDPLTFSGGMVGLSGASLNDIDGNGTLDLVTAYPLDNSIVVLEGTGSGVFLLPKFIFDMPGDTPQPIDVDSADLNGDGLIDVVVANLNTGNVGVLINKGGVGVDFTDVATIDIGSETRSVRLVDVDGDGVLDLTATSSGAGFTVALGNGNGSFGPTQSFALDVNPISHEMADLDGDGDLDAVFANFDSAGGVLLFNDGDGDFSEAGSYAADTGENTDVAVGDFHGDGRADLAVSNSGSDTVSIIDNVSDAAVTARQGDPVSITRDANGNVSVAARNTTGTPYVYSENAPGAFIVNDLTDAGVPKPTAPVQTWTAADGRAHVAFPTVEGLFVGVRVGDTWSLLNATTDASAGSAGVIVSDVTTFVDTSGVSYVAGFNADGDLMIAFFGPTDAIDQGATLTFQNVSDQLGDTPAFVGPFISYVTAWNGYNIAGLDANGDIQTIWTGGGNGQWFTSNLSDITNAPAYTGQLAVYLTPWQGINISGVTTDDTLAVTWWVPQFAGDWVVSDFNELYGTPTPVASTLTAYTHPWGGLNISGLTAEGDLVVFWWTPEFAGDPATDFWRITTLDDVIPGDASPAGPLDSAVAPDGSTDLAGYDSDGNVLVFSWDPATNIWSSTNVTDTLA